MWEPVALCCFTRRTGSLILGSLEVVGGLLGLVSSILFFASWEFIVPEVCQAYGISKAECMNVMEPTARITLSLMVFVYLIQLVCASMMIHGVRKSNHCLMIPYLIKNTIIIALNIVLISILLAFLSVVNFFIMIPVAYVYGSMIFMWTYFLLTVRAHYYEVKRGKLEEFHRLDEHMG